MVIIKNHMHNIYCYPYMMFSSISILCCPAVVRKFFLMVSMVELENHSLKDKLCCNVTINVILKCNVPCKVFQ